MAQSHLGKVAIVTGAGRGLGQVMALGLLGAGAKVVGVDADQGVLDQLAARAREDGVGAGLLPYMADVSREDSATAIVAQAVQRFGRLDILVNNAGLNLETVSPGQSKAGAKFWEVSPAEFRRIFEVNTVAPYLMARAALEPMRAQKWGRILNVTTSLDTMWRAGMIPYGGSKAANEAHTAAMAEELVGTGISVNVLVPGGAAVTRMTVSFGAAQAKLIRPEVMVAPLLWLTTAEADGLTGMRFIAARWESALPGKEAAEKCSAPAAWPQLGRQSIFP